MLLFLISAVDKFLKSWSLLFINPVLNFLSAPTTLKYLKIPYENLYFSEKFFNYINSLDTKIILIGEKTVKYSGEYAILGKNIVYSLYDEYVKNIPTDKIIDLTNDDYSPNNISLENIINDLTLISNSKSMIMIGCGGFFCTSLFTDKLLSINDGTVFSQFRVESNKQVFNDINLFLTAIQNV